MSSLIVAGIQARMGSSRLPGKSLMDLGGKPLIFWAIDRVKMSQCVDQVWLLTSTNPEDDILVEAVGDRAEVIRGDAQDVTSRYELLLKKTQADLVFRITGDCPFVDGQLLDQLARLHQLQNADYSHVLAQSYYEFSYPNGFNAELFSVISFQKMNELQTSFTDREHVTPAVERFPDQFKIARLVPPRHLSFPHWKLSVDTQDDLNRVRRVVAELGDTAETATVAAITNIIEHLSCGLK